jgi:hypothetical protein
VVKPAESRATAAFRAYTAERLHVAPADITDSSDILHGKHTRGSAQAYLMTYARDGRRCARGWATADGTVITPTQNLGRLFAEAGVWAKPPGASLDQLAEALAEDIVWSYAEDDRVEVGDGAKPPELVLAADGSGRLRFIMMSRSGSGDFESQFDPAVGGGGGGFGQTYLQVDVALTADHKATLTRNPFERPKSP